MIKKTVYTAMGILVLAGFTFAAQVEPAPKTYVEDRAGVLESQQEHQIIGLLEELEQKTAARIVVLTVDTTGGEDIHQYAFERADTWKFGLNQKSASVLLVVAVKDRKYRIEVGYQHEGILPDGFVGQVGRDYFVPNFRENRYYQGIRETTAVLAQKIAVEKGVSLTGMPEISVPGRGRGRMALPCGGMIMPLFILLILLSGRRSRGLLFWGLLTGSMMGGGGRYGGGGFGGRGFGGFGGGGGGGFGGGGAGGSW